MGLFERFLRHRKEGKGAIPIANLKTKKEISQWQDLAGYLPAHPDEYQEVSLIAAAIAAGGKSESSFVLKRLSKRNSEIEVVTLIATSIAAINQPASRFVIKSIKEKIL